MNRLDLIDDFDEVKFVARQIDDGVGYLEQKLSNVSRFGLSLKPEETRTKAENLLRNISEEMDCIKCNIESSSDEQKQILIDTIADNSSIQDFIEQTRREFTELEEIFRSKKDYQPFVPEKSIENTVIENNKSPEAEESLQNSFENCLKFHNNKKTSSFMKETTTSCINSPVNYCSRLDERMTSVKMNSNFERSFSDNLRLSCYSNILKPRRLNTADDTLRTPGNFAVAKNSV